MAKMKLSIYRIARKIYNRYIFWRNKMLFETTNFGLKGKNCMIGQPSYITRPQKVYLHDFARIGIDNIILNNEGAFFVGKYTLISAGLRVVPDQHTSTVGIPHCCLGASHIHDKVLDVIIDEDAWIGLNVILLTGCHIQRGSIIGANTLINRHTNIPPYSVIAGSPPRIIAARFNIEQILEHEEKLYPPQERFTREQLEKIFEKYYEGKRIFGVDGNLTQDEKESLKKAMEKTGFEYPEFK